MSDVKENPRRRSKVSLIALIAAGVALVLSPAIIIFVFVRPWEKSDPVEPVSVAAQPEQAIEGDFSSSNSITITLGERESGGGLRHIDTQNDGVTSIETINGANARVVRVAEGRSVGYIYFEIHPSFKDADVAGARIDVEYLDPHPGSVSLHYDARDAEEVSNPRYRQATPTVRLRGSNTWQTASFHTKNDANFGNRQNGGADFRLSVKAPILYVRGVTVTREVTRGEQWTVDHSASNSVGILLGEEKPEDGLRHRGDEADGRTREATNNGVVCRHLNRVVDNKTFGYLYFAIDPGFKRSGLTNARIDVEYLAPRGGLHRLQFDGLRNGVRHAYVSVLAHGGSRVRIGDRADYARVPVINQWTNATYYLTNAVFQNAQNGDSDFRFEVVPPDVYVRSVTVTKIEGSQ